MSMRTVDIKEATEPLAEYAQRAEAEAIVITVEGRPIAALVPVENADLETIQLGSHPKFLEIIERSRVRQEREGGVSGEEMRRLLDARSRAAE